jgi:hypothetical protein
MYGDIVVQNRTILSGNGFDMNDLEGLGFQFGDSARENVVSFALEFGSGAGRSLFRRKRSGIEAIGVRLTGRIFGLKLHLGTKGGGSVGLIVEPVCRRDQHKQDNQNHGQVVGPTASLIGPENSADDSSPEGAHISEPTSRPQLRHHACAGLDARKRRLQDCE